MPLHRQFRYLVEVPLYQGTYCSPVFQNKSTKGRNSSLGRNAQLGRVHVLCRLLVTGASYR